MNYILQLNGFWNWTRTNEISHLEVDLYLSILHIANTALWKTQFTIPNSSLGRFEKTSLLRARNKLVQYGLICYKKGQRGQAPVYEITKLYDDEEEKEVNRSRFAPQTAPNMQPKAHLMCNQNATHTKTKTKTKTNSINPCIPFEEISEEKVKEGSKTQKHKYGEYKNVLLSDEDIEKLKAEFPDYEMRIERLSEYIESKGAKYKSHLATIRSWARKDRGSGLGIEGAVADYSELENLTRARNR